VQLEAAALSGKRVLLAAEYIQYGGTRTYFKSLLDFYYKHGAHVCAVTSFLESDPEMAKYSRNYGFDLISFQSFADKFGLGQLHTSPTVWSQRKHHQETAAFRQLISEQNLSQTTISVGTSGLFLSAAAASNNSIMIAHGYPHGRRQSIFGSNFMAKMVPADLLILSMSNYSNELFRRTWNSRKRGVDVDTLYSTCGPIQQSIPLHQRSNTVLTAALVEDYKRPFDWINIAKQTHEATQIADLEFKWLGEGPQRLGSIQMTEELNLRFATFPGWQNNTDPYYNTAKVYLQTSSKESLGLSAVDALRHGVPSVVTSAGGLPEVVLDGVNGFVVPIGDISAASAAISELLCNTELWQKQSVAARDLYQDRFSPDKWDESMLAAHLEVRS